VYYTAVDGWAARRFNQVSTFGAWLDVIIDNIGRGILWTRISSVEKFLY
jgi:phosphatidylglycerophosphate synthase